MSRKNKNMKNKKTFTTILAIITLSVILYLKLAQGFTNKFFEYGNDTLIVILLLAFAERILLLTFLTPIALYQKLTKLGNRGAN